MVLVPTLRHKLFENTIFYLRMADKVWNPILKVYVLLKIFIAITLSSDIHFLRLIYLKNQNF